jgi:hypothetical protein
MKSTQRWGSPRRFYVSLKSESFWKHLPRLDHGGRIVVFVVSTAASARLVCADQQFVYGQLRLPHSFLNADAMKCVGKDS